MTVTQRVQASLAQAVLAVMFLVFAVTSLFVVEAQVNTTRNPRTHVVDPERTFRYASLQLDESTGLLVLERSSLERDNQDRGLLIETDSIDDDRKLCLELAGRGAHEHRCITLGQLRAWIAAGAPPASGRR